MKNTGADQLETTVDVYLPVFVIELPAFYIHEPKEMTGEEQPIAKNGFSQPILAINDGLDPIAKQGTATGLNEDESEEKCEQNSSNLFIERRS